MPTRTFMYWNIENFGAGKRGKYTVTGPQLVNFIANVIIRNNVSIFAMNEVRSSLGNQLGLDLAFALNSVQVTANWTHHASPKFMKGRDEQYLFLWRRDWIGNTNFVWAFDNPSSPPPLLGFPTQVTTARPPYLGYFYDATGIGLGFRVAAFHAPGPGYFNGVKRACNNLAKVADFVPTSGNDGVVIMGDCNVKFVADASVAGSFGAQAFQPLLAAKFRQADIGLTSLKSVKDADPSWTVEDAYNQPYDQVFVRNSKYVGSTGASREELLDECMNGNYLEGLLAAVDGQRTGMTPVSYTNVADAFVSFRKYVSDHMPVVVDIAF